MSSSGTPAGWYPDPEKLEDAGISFQEANDAATGSALFDEVVEIATDCVLER